MQTHNNLQTHTLQLTHTPQLTLVQRVTGFWRNALYNVFLCGVASLWMSEECSSVTLGQNPSSSNKSVTVRVKAAMESQKWTGKTSSYILYTEHPVTFSTTILHWICQLWQVGQYGSDFFNNNYHKLDTINIYKVWNLLDFIRWH